MRKASGGTTGDDDPPVQGGPNEGNAMGYGFGIFLLAVGLILALAVQDTISNVDLTLIGWIIALAGVLLIVLTGVTMNRGRASRTVSTTTHSDGSQTTTEQQQRNDAPPAV